MSRARIRPGQVYRLLDFPDGVLAVVRYDGDPDVFTALAHNWLASQWRHPDDEPVAVAPPEPRLYRMNPYQGDDYGWILGEPSRPGRGVWLGALLRTVQIGCSICHHLHGRHVAGCLNADLTGLVTLQFTCNRRAGNRFVTEETIHAVRVRGTDTPGDTLCGIPRFDPALNLTWTVGGARHQTHLTYRGCYLCGQVARCGFPGLTITGNRRLAEVFAGDCRVPLAPHLSRQPVGV